MPYVTSFGRLAMLDAIEEFLRARFGDEGVKLLPAISAMNDAEKYKAVTRALATATTLDEVRQACAEASAPPPRGRKGGNGKRGQPEGLTRARRRRPAAPQQQDFPQEVQEHEEGRRMPYVTSFGRLAMLDLIEAQLRAKFGDEGVKLLPAISAMNDAEKYKAVGQAIVTATTVDEVRRACAEASAPPLRGKKGGNGKRGRPRT